jgi:hypothetical protein
MLLHRAALQAHELEAHLEVFSSGTSGLRRTRARASAKNHLSLSLSLSLSASANTSYLSLSRARALSRARSLSRSLAHLLWAARGAGALTESHIGLGTSCLLAYWAYCPKSRKGIQVSGFPTAKPLKVDMPLATRT